MVLAGAATLKFVTYIEMWPVPTATFPREVQAQPPSASVLPACRSLSIAQLGALVINLSPSRLKGLFPGKTGPTKALHMAFEVARDVSMAPVVIYIDECDQVRTFAYTDVLRASKKRPRLPGRSNVKPPVGAPPARLRTRERARGLMICAHPRVRDYHDYMLPAPHLPLRSPLVSCRRCLRPAARRGRGRTRKGPPVSRRTSSPTRTRPCSR